MAKESQEKFKKAVKKEEEREEALENMEEMSGLSDEEFTEEKKKTLEELDIPEDRAEGFLKGSEESREPKKD